MKTSHILLSIITVITLTGMVATDVLLKQQYTKIDWGNPYQNFDRRALPIAKHLVIDATPTVEVIVEKSANSQALLSPEMARAYHMRQQGDTLFLSFKTDEKGKYQSPRDNSWGKLGVGVVLRMPAIENLRVKDGCLTLQKLTAGPLTVSLQNTRLRTEKVDSKGDLELIESQNSFAMLGADHYQSLRITVQDSSGIQVNDSQIDTFAASVSPKAEVQLRGKSLKWLSKTGQ
ncbi:hypothetical protein [Spirosoma validum]|uniref:Uncharacterized protein n=1 Tax=Spirosoma validum TaxID=2771355 RepID=A0A927GDG0_9BACT|nr:hypothetical protein [Spirosoma validum]MBD2753521.1 hypothetical protein [Spirosoma validum]